LLALLIGETIGAHVIDGLDWAGRGGVVGGVVGFVLAIGLRQRGYRRIRRIGRATEVLTVAPLDFSGYWALTGIVVGFIFGVIHG
jgi:hypothetical protein